ncbi:MAG: hypothetical protein O7149_03530 [Wolbachia endosymbiont of Hylaeus sinuatus]|uniref:hypothetical protein n=1 Tax=unclassified Wolbachia TaxID=2640676 RepID=UPI00157A89FD|nr:hypothetical protein [Wolbachia endosymbiont of Cardiocondyla obscurior]MDX5507663.1 hypothetical protein [Wolbachia endosymbiont of Hylaeus sinuatus]
MFIAKRQPSSRCLLAGSMLRDTADESRGMTVRGGISSSRYVLAAKRYRGGMTS